MFRRATLEIENLIRTGTVVESKASEGKMLARVDVHGRVTDWLPVFGISNSFMKLFIPICVGEQVSVLCEFAEADAGLILPSIYHEGNTEPEGANAHTMVMAFHDGGKFSYDTQVGEMTLEAVTQAKVIAPHIEMVCETSHCTGSMDIDGALHVGEQISTDSTVSDAQGDLSNFSTSDGASRA